MFTNPKYKNTFFSPSGSSNEEPIVPAESTEETQPQKTKKSLVSAVKKFVKALGGQDNDSNNLVEIIDKAADDIGQDNESSGNEVFAITFTGTDSGSDAECDKTKDEILAAYNNNKQIEVYYLFKPYGSNPVVKIRLNPQFTFFTTSNELTHLIGRFYFITSSSSSFFVQCDFNLSNNTISCSYNGDYFSD